MLLAPCGTPRLINAQEVTFDLRALTLPHRVCGSSEECSGTRLWALHALHAAITDVDLVEWNVTHENCFICCGQNHVCWHQMVPLLLIWNEELKGSFRKTFKAGNWILFSPASTVKKASRCFNSLHTLVAFLQCQCSKMDFGAQSLQSQLSASCFKSYSVKTWHARWNVSQIRWM